MSVNWQPGATVTLPAAITLLQGLKARLSRSLAAPLQDKPPQVIDVVFEPASPPAAPSPQNVFVLDGRTSASPQTLSWITDDPASTLSKTMVNGGRVVVRINCSFLFDAKNRMFSPSLDSILALTSLRLPGGVCETFFFVQPG